MQGVGRRGDEPEMVINPPGIFVVLPAVGTRNSVIGPTFFDPEWIGRRQLPRSKTLDFLSRRLCVSSIGAGEQPTYADVGGIVVEGLRVSCGQWGLGLESCPDTSFAAYRATKENRGCHM